MTLQTPWQTYKVMISQSLPKDNVFIEGKRNRKSFKVYWIQGLSWDIQRPKAHPLLECVDKVSASKWSSGPDLAHGRSTGSTAHLLVTSPVPKRIVGMGCT